MPQRTGSFKFRGTYNTISAPDAAARARGVIAVSSATHAQGVAVAARIFDVSATIVMPADAPAPKSASALSRAARASSSMIGNQNRDVVVARVVEEIGGTSIYPFNDPNVIVGQRNHGAGDRRGLCYSGHFT